MSLRIRTPAFDILSEPFRIKSLALESCIVMAPMTRSLAPEGTPRSASAAQRTVDQFHARRR